MAAGRRREAFREVEARAPGKLRLERRAYLLLPGTGQRETYDEYVISHRIEAKRRAPELPFTIPRLGQPYPSSSVPAHLVASRVQEVAPERIEAFEDAVFRAVFADLADTGDPDVLRRCAASAGVDPGEVERALGDPALMRRVLEQHAEAEAHGVEGIPALVLPGQPPVMGGVATDVYRRALAVALRYADEDEDGAS